MKVRLVLLVLLVIFLSSFSLSEYIGTTSNSMPTITIDFNETVEVLNASVYAQDTPNTVLLSLNNNTINISYLENANGENATVEYALMGFLFNDVYVLQTIVDDFFGNRVEYEFNFTIAAVPIDIDLIKPEQGWANNSVFEFEIKTSEDANCWYTIGDESDPTGGGQDTVLLNTTDSIYHYDSDFFFEGVVWEPMIISVVCSENDGGITMKQFTLNLDDSPPLAVYEFSENPLIDRSYPYVNLTVESLQWPSGERKDRVGCRIKENSGNYDNFTNVNFSDVSTYNYKNYILLNFTDEMNDWNNQEKLYDNHLFNYSVICRNKARLEPDPTPKELELNIHFSPDFNIEKISPDDYINFNNPDIIVKTSVNTQYCKIKEHSENVESYVNMTGGQRVYTVSTSISAEQLYRYDIYCQDNYSGATFEEETISFTIDHAPPTNFTIDAHENTCSLSKIKFSLDAEDALSGIDYFNYTITGPNSTIIESDTVSKSNAENIEVSESLIENATYTIAVYVYDRAGNVRGASTTGALTKTITATDSSIAACDRTPPAITFNETQDLGVTYVRINCSDTRSGCADSYNYDILENITDSCTYSSTGSWSVSSEYAIYTKSKLCVKAFDNNDNEKTESTIINIVFDNECSNGELDGDETDVDCGGSCSNCLNGDSCLINDDCEDNWCHNNICSAPNCNDSIWNGFESDVDCGGLSCNSCTNGKACVNNGDCISNWCNNNVCEASSCNDFIWNGFESDVDCGGDNCTGCEIGQNCNIDSDCLSDYCEYGTCSEETEAYPLPETKKANVIAIILLILGILLVLAGAGYLVYDKYYLQPLEPKTSLESESKVEQKKKPLTKEQLLALQNRKKLMKDKFKERLGKTKDKLSSKFSTFEEKTEEVKKRKEKEQADKAKATIKDLKKTWDPEHSVSPLDKKKLDSGLRGEYVKLGELKDNAKKILNKDPDANKQYGKDIFAALEKIQSKIDKKAEVSKKDNKDDSIKQYATEDDFKKLDELIKKSKEGTEKKVIQDDKKQVKEDKVEEPSSKLQTKDDVFDALTEIASASKKSKSSKETEIMDTSFTSDNLVDLFKNKDVNIDVFKVILKELLNSNKLNKKDVSGLIFKLLEQKLIEKDVAHKILKEMELINE